ncbi:MAG: phosphoglycerate dehydrogenase [Trueperaceae bacterium]|nr:phosphoglycerate dehydrogenase [Trueperaceae bacterium]
MTKRILITARAFSASGPHYELLEREGYECIFKAPEHSMDAETLGALLPGIDGLILGLDDCSAKALDKADKLKIISRFGVGFDNVDVAAASAKGIIVARAVGGNASSVVELALGLMFALARSLVLSGSAAKKNEWPRPRGWELGGKTLGLIGFGIIGKQLAEKATALGMKVIAFDPYEKTTDSVELVTLDELLNRSDIVSLHCALTHETRNLLNKARLAQMKQGAYLINTARGAIIDETALYDVLVSGHLGGAAMDAFASEPPLDNPLLQLDNFIATPHIGANTREAAANVSMLVAQNLVDVLSGKPCPNLVNPEIYEAL